MTHEAEPTAIERSAAELAGVVLACAAGADVRGDRADTPRARAGEDGTSDGPADMQCGDKQSRPRVHG